MIWLSVILLAAGVVAIIISTAHYRENRLDRAGNRKFLDCYSAVSNEGGRRSARTLGSLPAAAGPLNGAGVVMYTDTEGNIVGWEEYSYPGKGKASSGSASAPRTTMPMPPATPTMADSSTILLPPFTKPNVTTSAPAR